MLHRMLPLANHSPSPARHPLRALILTPTRELAIQVFESAQRYGKHTALRSYCAFGGVNIKPQIEALHKGVEILVATPGRLLDHIEQKSLQLGQVQFLVLDEADRMLDMGFIPDVSRIIKMLPRTRQSLLFSATFSQEIKRLADDMLRSPQLLEVARRNTVSGTIEHRVHTVEESDKRSLLIHLLQSEHIEQCIVFVKTKIGCARLARALQRAGISADAIHGDKHQQDRLSTLNAFKTNEVTVLVATDVAARGLDIEELPHVINYELPHVPEDYIHRIGRTGRAGNTGQALSLVCPAEQPLLLNIEKLLNKQIERLPNPDLARHSERRASRRHDQRPSRAKRGRIDHELIDTAARPPMIAEDGFDFSKPYQPDSTQPAGEIPDSPRPPPALPAQSRRVVAALLGGMGKKIPL